MRGILVLAVLLLAVPSAAATTVHLTDHGLGTIEDESVCPERPRFAVADAPPSPGKAYQGLSGCGGVFTYEPGQAMVLDADARYQITLGCDRPSASGPFSLGVHVGFQVGGERIGSDVWDVPWVCGGPDDLIEVSGVVAEEPHTIDAGERLVASVVVSDLTNRPVDDLPNIHVLTGPDRSFLTLREAPPPSTPPATLRLVEERTTEALRIDDAWAVPRDAIHTIHWDTDLEILDLSLRADHQQGSARLTLVAADGLSYYDLHVDAPMDIEERVAQATDGGWTVQVVYDGYVGDLALELAEREADGMMAPSVPDVEKEVPGFTLAAVGATLFAVVAILRRRHMT